MYCRRYCQLNGINPKIGTMIPKQPTWLILSSRFQTSDFSPILKPLAQLFTVVVNGQLVLFWVEGSSNWSKSGKKSMGLPRGFEFSHSSLSHSCGLMGVFAQVVQSLMRSMLHVLHHLFLRRFIAL